MKVEMWNLLKDQKNQFHTMRYDSNAVGNFDVRHNKNEIAVRQLFRVTLCCQFSWCFGHGNSCEVENFLMIDSAQLF
jgi:hypothetical protein